MYISNAKTELKKMLQFYEWNGCEDESETDRIQKTKKIKTHECIIDAMSLLGIKAQ